MATIQINRTKTGVVPVSLADGELYIDQLNGKLYWANSLGAVQSTTLLIPTLAPSATTDTTNASNITSGRLAALQGGIPAGAVLDFAMNTPPSGWMECNGAAVSRATYAALFAAIGTTWGAGDGSTTFNLPDARGIFRRGWDHGRGLDSGRAFASYQADAFGSHNHNIAQNPHAHGLNFVNSYGFGAGGATSGAGSAGSTANSYADITILPAGGAETVPKNNAYLTCIKY